MPLLRELFDHFVDLSPGTVGFEDFESPSNHLMNKDTSAGKISIRRFFGYPTIIKNEGVGQCV